MKSIKSSSPAKSDRKQLHQQLKALVLDAQSHPPGSKKRKIALDKLVRAIQASGQLFCKYKIGFPEELYNEVLQETFFDVCRKIDRYDPAKAQVITWVNNLLWWRFLQGMETYNKHRQELSLDTPVDISGMSFLDILEQPEVSPGFVEELQECLQQDPDGSFAQRHVRGRPEANFRAIALRRLAGESWKKISADWGIPIPTLSVFYQRSCRHFIPKFREYLL